MAKDDNAASTRAAFQRAPAFWRLRLVACYVTIVACLPYLTLKALWLFGVSTGAVNAAGATELLDARHVVGDLITAGMEVVAILLALALTYPWGRRVPVVVVLVPIWVGVGLLAPILVGLPLGLVAQALVGGSPVPTGNGLGDWVYAVVYGGFVVQAVGLLAAFIGYAFDRWSELFWIRTTQLKSISHRWRGLTMVAAVIAIGYAALLGAWSLAGERLGGPGGFDTVAQRTFLLATGAIVLGGAVAVLAMVWRWGKGRILASLILAWVGVGVLVTSGPTHIALSNQGDVSPLLALASLVAVLSGLLLAGSATRVLSRSLAR